MNAARSAGPPPAKRSCSVVINTFNRAASLRQTLAGLRHLRHPSFEVVVVNGPSTDDTEAVLAEWAGAIKVVRTTERNLSVSRNLGIAASAGEVVAFIDDDAYPDPDWLNHLDAAFDDPEVAAAGGPVLDHTGTRWQAKYNLANRRGDAWTVDGPNPAGTYGSPWSYIFTYTMGTNSSFRRSAIVDIGGFDEEYEYYLDETDVCVRLLDRGWLIATLDDGVVYHKFLPSDIRTERRALRDRYSVVKNRVYFALRHGQPHGTVADLLADADTFVEWHRRDLRGNASLGLIEQIDLDRFEIDVPRAYDQAIARALSGEPLTRRPGWFDVHPRPFVPFPTLRPDGGPLHLVLLSGEYPPGPVNGIGRFVHTLATGLGHRGHTVHVITASAAHATVDLEDDVWVHRVALADRPQPPDIDLPQRLWNFAAAAAEEVDAIDRRRTIDIVEFEAWDVEGAAIARAGTYTTVLALHTPLLKVVELDETFPADNPDIRRIVEVERRVYESASAYLAAGPSVVAEVEHHYGVRLDPASVSTVVHGMPPASGRGPAPVDDGLDVLFVGRLEHRKGIDTFLDAVPAVLARCPDARFTVVGDDTIPAPGGGTYRSRFESAGNAVDRVRFLGRVDDRELERRYAGCTMLVAPSRYESFGLVLLEAMRYGKPVIGGNEGGMRGIVDGNGILVPPGDVDALADAITDLLTDPQRRHQLGARSLQVFNERYSVDRMVDDAIGLYRRLLAPTGEVPDVPRGRRPIGIDLSSVASCPRCHGPVTTVADVVTADGLVKQGRVVCERCDATVGVIDHFTWNFHEQGARPAAPADPPRLVPALGEHRLDADEIPTSGALGWFRHERFVVAGDDAKPLTFDVRATDVTLRFLRHRHSGIVELLVDGELVGEVDLFLPDGALVTAYPVVTDAPFRRHTVEIRPTGRRHPSATGQQVLLEEVVLLGPRQRGLAFDLPEPLNRGNPMSPRVLRYLDELPVDAWVLECGGGDRRGDRPRHVNFEFLPFELADALGDIHHLPFRDEAFDLVFSQAVFEHVRNPFEAAAELIRVTRPGGFILTEVAFLQPLHAVPYHFFNMSQWGAEELFRGCEIVESDWFGDLSDSVDWFFRSANLDSDAPPKMLAKVRRKLKELDRHIDHDDLKPVAAGVFVAARKP